MEGQEQKCTCCSRCCGGVKALAAIALLLLGAAGGFFLAKRCVPGSMMCPMVGDKAAPVADTAAPK